MNEFIAPSAQQHLAMTVVAILFLALVIMLVRRRVMREDFAILWLGIGGAILLVSLFPDLLAALAAVTGIVEVRSLVFLLGIFALLMIALYLTVVVTRQQQAIIRLTREVARLNERAHRENDSGGNEPV